MKLTIPRGATAMSPIPVGIRSDGAGGKLIVFRPEGGVHRLVSGMNGSGKTYGELPVLVTLGALQVRLHHAALATLASADVLSLEAWCYVVYLLAQAPLAKKGSDALHRTFTVAVGAVLLGEPPRLAHDVDLRAMVVGQDAFAEYLLAVNTARVGADVVPDGDDLS